MPAPERRSYTLEAFSSGWYLRGDVGYRWGALDSAVSASPFADPTDSHLGQTMVGTLGIGIKSRWLRTDLTVDYWGKSKFHGLTTGTTCGGGGPCFADNRSGYTAWLLLANAYADLGTYHGVTPYIGAGIGGAHIQWDNVVDTNGNANPGAGTWRFAYALMAGASYCLTHNLDLDVGYRFTRVEGGRMFEFANGVGPGYDKGMNVHEVRAGLRYNFGGDDGGRCSEQVAYQPGPSPVYK